MSATALFVQSLINAVGVAVTVPSPVLFLIVSALVYLFAVRDIRFSSRLGLMLEVISVAIIAMVCFLSWQAHGYALDAKQLHLQGASFVTQALLNVEHDMEGMVPAGAK